jgi:low density lipoprotein receptor-related protein 5/6
VEGYEMRENGVCKPTGKRGYLLLLDKVDIRSIQPVVGGGAIKKVVRDLAQTFAFDYHLGLNRVYWTELTYQGAVIKYASLKGRNNTDITTVIDTGLSSPHGLAIDWISNKIYWTDVMRTHLSVAELDGSKRRVLFSNDMEKPRGMAVDPTTGYMYWTDWGAHPRIERASMDGTDRMILHSSNMIWPNAVTIDYVTQCIYWIDAKLDYIETSFRDGSRRKILYRERSRHFRPFGLTLFKDELFMADIDAREVRAFEVKSNTSELVTIFSEILEPMSVVAVHEGRQPHFRVECVPKEGNFTCNCENVTVPVDNPCQTNNGGCEYMCLLSSSENRTHSCVCPTGHRLHPNGRNCLGLDKFLILVDNSEVYIVSLDVPHPVNVRVPLVGTDIVSAVTWDSRTDTMYFADLGRRTISAASITGENQRVIIDGTSLGAPVGIALDWLHDRLYWADSERDTIESSDLDGGRRVIVVYSGLDRPRDVVVDPERGLMFWSDWSEKKPRIMRANLDGSQRDTLVSEYLRAPNGIALDYEKQVVYWVDGLADSLEMVNYDGSNRTTIIDFDLDYHPSGLDVSGDLLYWTNWRENDLQSINVSDTAEHTIMIRHLVQSRDVNVFHRNRNHSAFSPCKNKRNGGCSYVCVTRARKSGVVKPGCLCPIGYPLLDDERTCASEINTTLLFPTANAVHMISQDVEDYIAGKQCITVQCSALRE